MGYQASVRKISLLNRYYKITRFYSFIIDILIKAVVILAAFILIFFVLNFFFNLNDALNHVVQTYSSVKIFLIFLASETSFGIAPPEIFILWASRSSLPIFNLFMLSCMSYLAGIIAYLIGTRLHLIPKIKIYIEYKIRTHVNNVLKWGGLFVFIGAMLPIPHSAVSMACGLIRFNFKHYLLWALFRFLRFGVYVFFLDMLV